MYRRRTFLLLMATLSISIGWAGTAEAARAKTRYNPRASFSLTVHEVEYRRTPQGRPLMARIYQPVGAGPFPVVIDLHGGGWNAKDRTAEQPFDRAIAAAGALVIAVDMTRAPEASYPAGVVDANYAVRWVKASASAWQGDVTAPLGIFASSSGGHVAELLMLRPRDTLYTAARLAKDPRLDATVDYLILRSPVSDVYARYQNAVAMNNAAMIKNNTNYFSPFTTIHESNPFEILKRGEHAMLKPMLIMQGALDDNVRPAAQSRFVEAYRAAGGKVDFVIFAGSEHEWIAKPGPQTDRAHARARAFIARQVNPAR